MWEVSGGPARTPMLEGKQVVVGVTGGIAAYKAAEVVSRLRQLGAEVHVIMTRAATQLVGPLTFQTLSGNPVLTDLFAEPKRWNVEHIALADRADLLLIVPATANILGKLASGIADDYLSTTVMATAAPVVLAPAMHHRMWQNPVVQENVQRLRRLGYEIIEPEHGRLASGGVGMGRLPDPPVIVEAVVRLLGGRRDLDGLKVLVTAGPTRERLDPVRYLSNFSSGKMGYALAAAACRRGAQVILISGPVVLEPPTGVELVAVESAEEMAAEVRRRVGEVKVVVMAAAVADYRPAEPSTRKLKRGPDELALRLVPNADILASLRTQKKDLFLVGFAAETEDLVANARAKLERKHLDLICANRVDLPGCGFGSDTNALTLIDRRGRVVEIPLQDKLKVAHAVWDHVVRMLAEDGGGCLPDP